MTKKQNNITIRHIDTRLIVESPLNPRKYFSLTELQELSESIKSQGLLQPITIRPVNEKDITQGYEIVCGARRFKACGLAEMKQIPAIVRVMTDDEAFDAMITENLQRKDVEPIDEAIAFKALLDKGSSFEELAARFGKSQQFIRQRIKLNDLVPEFSDMMQSKDLQVSHAQELCKLEIEEQNEIFREHYSDDASSYYNWKGITTKDLKENLANRFNDLDEEEFDKTECETCQHRCGANMLFQEFEANTCVNTQCFENKNLAHRADLVEERIKDGQILVVHDKNHPLIAIVEERGYTPIKLNTFKHSHFNNTPYDNDKLKEGKAKLACAIGYFSSREATLILDNVAVSSEDGSVDVQETLNKESLETLQAKDKRNKEIQNEKTVADLRTLMSDSKYKTKTKPLSDNEMNAMYAVILLKCDYRFTRDILNGKESDILDVVQNMSDDDRSKMVRDFINDLCTGSNSTYCKSTQAVLQSISSEAYPVETKGIELKHEETYLKRKERIDQQIKAIEA